MSALTPYQTMNIAEANKRAGYDELAAVLGEIAQNNPFFNLCPFLPSSHGLENQAFQAKRLGSGTWSKANGPLQSISSEGEIIKEPVKMYEGDSQVDSRILVGAEDPYKVRDSEDALNMEGLMQALTYDLFYASQITYPDSIKSFSARRASLGTYCKGAGGSGGDTTSLWTFEFSPRTAYMIYPKGGSPGIVNKDMGLERVPTPTDSTKQMRAWVRHYEFWGGFVLRNERAMIRYANIETTGSSNIFSPTDYIKNVQAQLPSMGKGAVAFANRTLFGQITADAYNKSNAAYSIRDIEGFGPVAYVANVPLQMLEALLDTESVVS